MNWPLFFGVFAGLVIAFVLGRFSMSWEFFRYGTTDELAGKNFHAGYVYLTIKLNAFMAEGYLSPSQYTAFIAPLIHESLNLVNNKDRIDIDAFIASETKSIKEALDKRAA